MHPKQASYPSRYSTSDLHLASFLRCRGFSLRAIGRESEKAVFTFDDSSELRSAIIDYVNDGQVPARPFCNTLRDLKALTRDSATRSAGE